METNYNVNSCNVSEFGSAEQNGLNANTSVKQKNFKSRPALSNRNMNQSVLSGSHKATKQARCTPNTRSISHAGPHYADSKASENQSKHEPRIIAVCKAHSLRSWRGFRASAVGQQCVNRGRLMGGGGSGCGGSKTAAPSSLWAARSAALYNLNILDPAISTCCMQTQKYCNIRVQATRVRHRSSDRFSLRSLRYVMI
jgi:hypothetical protein